MSEFLDPLKDFFLNKLNEYDNLVFGLILGSVLTVLYNKYVANRNVRQAYKEVLKAKDEQIATLKMAVYVRMGKMKVDKEDKQFFNKLKNLFK